MKKRVLVKTSILLVIAVHAQESCACTRFLCMHKNLVHAHQLQVKSMVLREHVFSRMGFIWKMGRSSDRQISSRGDARLFYFHDFSEKIGFPARGRFHDFCDIFRDFYEK